MFRRILFIATFLTLGLSGTAVAAPSSPNGYWVTSSGGAVVQIAPCGGDLCGRLIGIVLDPGAPVPMDWQGRSECGLELLQPARADNDGTWHGEIINPRNGSEYHVEFHVDQQGQLRLRGYVGLPLFGETQIWHRFDGAAPLSCRLTPGQIAEAAAHASTRTD